MTENTEFLNTTFKYVGGKLKLLAKFFFVVGILASVILGIVMFVNAGDASEMDYIGESMSGFYTTFGFIILIGGTIMTVLFSFVLYAFGAIAEKYLNEKEEKEADLKARNAYNAQIHYYQNNSDGNQDKFIGILNQMLANGQITQDEFDKRYSEITGTNSEQASVKVCPQCHTELKEGAAFCQKCGAEIN